MRTRSICALLVVLAGFASSRSLAQVITTVRVVPSYLTSEADNGLKMDLSSFPITVGLLSNRFAVHATFPYEQMHAEVPVTYIGGPLFHIPVGGQVIDENGPGDVVVAPSFAIVEGGLIHRPWVWVGARVKVPTADSDKYLGTGKYDYGPDAGIMGVVNSRLLLFGSAFYDVRGDTDLDGDVDATDKTKVRTSYEGVTLGRGVLSASSVAMRKGYAGYETLSGLVGGKWLARNRVLAADLGRWNRRDPLGDTGIPYLYDYCDDGGLDLVDPDGEKPESTQSSSQTLKEKYEGIKSKYKKANAHEVRVAITNPIDTINAWHAAQKAVTGATALAGPVIDTGKGNALLHCIWSCEMCKDANEAFAKEMGDAHENGDKANHSKNKKKTKMGPRQRDGDRFEIEVEVTDADTGDDSTWTDGKGNGSSEMGKDLYNNREGRKCCHSSESCSKCCGDAHLVINVSQGFGPTQCQFKQTQ